MSGLPNLDDAGSIALWNRAASGFLRETLDKIMMSSASTATPARHAFDKHVDEVKPSKSDINALILDYLTVEGYTDAAANFSKEANLPPHQASTSVEVRQEIQNHIHSGNIQTAIEMLNDYEPEILDEDKALHFSLLRLQLVELIRTCNTAGGDITPALTFATEQLGPRAPTNPKFLEDLEMTMALLLFPAESLEPQLAALLDPNLRREAAASVNMAILTREHCRGEAALSRLVKLRAWAETSARARGTDLPDHLDIGLSGENGDGHSRRQLGTIENGHDSIMTA